MNGARRFNPLEPGFLADPYPHYERLRREDPVHWSITGSWVLTRHDDIKALLSDPRFLTVDTPERVIERGERYARTGPGLAHLNRFMRGFFIFSDPPAHPLYRTAARAAFASITAQALSRIIAQITAGLIEDLARHEQADLVAAYAGPLACRTIGRVMGMADTDAAHLQRLSHRIAPVLDSLLPLERYQEMNEAAGEMLAFFDQALAAGTDAPRFLRELFAALPSEDARDLLAPVASAVFFAGQETTVNALANGIHLLASRPGARTAAAGGALGGGAMHELLRYESPVQLTARQAAVGVELRGRTIEPGQRVVLYLGAANRDPAVFAEPDRLDLARDARAHLAFGGGGHRCIGAHFALEEMQQGITALFAHFPGLSLVHAEPHRLKNVTIRGHAELLVALQGAPP